MRCGCAILTGGTIRSSRASGAGCSSCTGLPLGALRAGVAFIAFRPLFTLWPLRPGCTRIAFFAFKRGKLLSGEIRIGKRVALVTLFALRTLWAN